jgi:sugar phosphate isomerase/epimerase
LPDFAITEFSTLNASFEEDLDAYREAGAGAIGICEIKLVEGREREQLDSFRASGLRASACIPAVPSILPLPALLGPTSPEERIEAITAGMRRLAPFEPSAFVCLTGPPGELHADEARRTVVAGLGTIADEAARLGVPLGVEPMNAHFREEWALVTTLGEAAGLIEEAGSPGLGLTFDTWQLWDTPNLLHEIEAYANRIVAVHVADWREPTRSWCDRVLPGDGVIDFGPILASLESAGWEGCYELEIFSDDGAFGESYGDSLWSRPAAELAQQGHESFLAAWERAVV